MSATVLAPANFTGWPHMSGKSENPHENKKIYATYTTYWHKNIYIVRRHWNIREIYFDEFISLL